MSSCEFDKEEAGSQDCSDGGYPTHLTKNWSWRRYLRESKMRSTSYSSSPSSVITGGGSSKDLPGMVFGLCGVRSEAWNTSWIFIVLGSFRRKAVLPTCSVTW